MKIAYLDCFSGVSGDMILGALIDAGLPLDDLRNELKKLGLDGYCITAERVVRKGISGTKFTVEVTVDQPERHLADIEELIGKSRLDDDVKDTGRAVFRRIGAAEAAIHDQPVDRVHFHEIGAVDSILDIMGALIGFKQLGVTEIHCSKVHLGTGTITCSHGTIPVPAPATAALLQGVPVYSRGIEAELTTPTGAGLITTVAASFGPIPDMTVETVGYGAGSRELPQSNMLRVIIGRADESCGSYEEDTVVLVETNIDDMSPEIFSYLFEKLGPPDVLDVFTTPILMKKNRPAVKLSVLTTPAGLDRVLDEIFRETTTLGVRLHHVRRRKLTREIMTVSTRFGQVTVKIGKSGGRMVNLAPEYEDCRARAKEHDIPLEEVFQAAKAAALLSGGFLQNAGNKEPRY